MSENLICPVCGRSGIDTNVCPNCETDLSTYKMLVNLSEQAPREPEEKAKNIPLWLPIGIAILFLLLGLGLGVAGNSVIAKQPQIAKSPDSIASSISKVKTEQPPVISTVAVQRSSPAEQPNSSSCDGFNYIVRRGDSLSSIAFHLYGESNMWSLISRANPTIQGRENSIEIGEQLLLPNLDSSC
ncbi:MAG: LysM domain-containing protein [Cyanobacteria bacterium P01_G01_bin.19]